MKAFFVISNFIILVCGGFAKCNANVYVIIYATLDGKTGHAGLAVDNYKILSFDQRVDTVSDGTVTYYDLWPSNDDFGFFSYSKPQPALYYKLPNAIWSKSLTLDALYYEGIPHRERYPPDAIFKIASSFGEDHKLNLEIESITQKRTQFVPRFYNCTDFVNEVLKTILGRKLRVKEFIPFSFTSTPNKLCARLMEREDVSALKAPQFGMRSFLRERVMKRRKHQNPFEPPTGLSANKSNF